VLFFRRCSARPCACPRLGRRLPALGISGFSRLYPARAARLIVAVVASSVVGLVVDSVVFLWLAFGSLEFLLGQIVGKAWMVLLVAPSAGWIRRRDARLGIAPV